MLLDFFIIFGLTIVLLLILFLLKFKKEFSKNLLSIYFVGSFFFLLDIYAYQHKIYWLGAICVLFSNGFGFISGPFLFFYVKALVFPKKTIIRFLLKHLSPYFIFWLFVSLPLSISLFNKDLSIFKEFYPQTIVYIINFIENIFYLVYVIKALHLVKQIKDENKNIYSSSENDLNWMKNLLYGILFIVFLNTLNSVYEIYNPLEVRKINSITAYLMILLYCILGYRGLFQSKILIPTFEIEPNKSNYGQLSYKKKNQQRIEEVFSKEELNAMENKLFCLMKEEKLYLNQSLNLRELSIKMELPDKKLTDFINQYLNTNFQTLINTYRIKDFKKRILDENSRKFTLFSIAQECGFNSKASFNRVFKQFEKCTPTEFLKKHQK